MQTVIFEAAAIGVAIGHDHLALVALVILPVTFEVGTIAPSDHSETVTLARLEVAFELGFLELLTHAWQAVVVLKSAVAVSATVLKLSAELVTILVVHFR